MSSSALDLCQRDSTAAFSSPGDARASMPVRTEQPAFRWLGKDSVLLTLVGSDDDHYVISGGSLEARMFLEDSLWQSVGCTTSSRPPFLIRRVAEKHAATWATPTSRTAAQEAIAEIRSISRLTNEEIAPLVGVSRRSVQSWLAGERISARKEQRLRTLCDAVRALAAANPEMTRRRILDRTPGNVSAYDLLAEGRFGEAADLALGRRTAAALPASSQAQSLAAQLDHYEGHTELPPERLDRRLSGRMQR
jgi:DNA-binding transcriptional regulator YiaG